MPMFKLQYSTYNGYMWETPENSEISCSDSAKFVFQFRVHKYIELIAKPANAPPFKVEEICEGTVDKTFEIELSTSHRQFFSESEITKMLRKVKLARYTTLIKQISTTATRMCNRRCEKIGLKIEVWDKITYVHAEQETVERVMLESGEGYALVPASQEAIERLERIKFRIDNEYGCSDCRVCLEDMEIGFEVIQMPCKVKSENCFMIENCVDL